MTDSGAIEGRGKTVTALDLSTNYHEAGSGAPVILLHGSGPGVSAWTNWRHVIPRLQDGLRVLAPDMAGFGFTERKADTQYDIKLWVKHLGAIMDALDVPRAHLVGNSFGGSLALAFAMRHPERVDRLVLMGTPCGPFMMTPGLAAGWGYQPSREAMRAVMAHFPYDPAIITDALIEERYQTSLIPGAQEGLRNLLAKPNPDGPTPLSGMPEDRIAAITAPTLVLQGREDRVIPADMALRIANAMPNADLHLFGKCGHWVQAERHEDFVVLCRRHLLS